MKTYTIDEWPQFLKAIKGKKLKVHARVGYQTVMVGVTPSAFKECLQTYEVSTFTLKVLQYSAYVEYTTPRSHF